MKPDTWNRLRNAPVFNSSLFPDDILATAEQDIAKFESTPSAQGPGPGTGQHSGRKHQLFPVISPGHPVDSTLNDNYCWIDPHLELTVEDPIVQDINQNVSLHVVCRAPCVTGLSGNKDIRPNQLK